MSTQRDCDERDCGNCGHDGAVHNMAVGCTYGWKYDNGLGINDGCDCNWAHVDLSAKEW